MYAQTGKENKFKLCKVTGSDRLYTMTGITTQSVGWRCVYLGYNKATDLTRFWWSRYRRLIPEGQIIDRLAERTHLYGFRFELKITNRLQPSIFWGDQGKQLLREVAIFLEQPKEAKELPVVRSIVYPLRVGDALQVWVNGEYTLSLSNHQEELEFVTELQSYKHCKPSVIIQALRTFQLPED